MEGSVLLDAGFAGRPNQAGTPHVLPPVASELSVAVYKGGRFTRESEEVQSCQEARSLSGVKEYAVLSHG